MSLEEALKLHSEKKPDDQVYESLVRRNNCEYTVEDCIEHIVGLRDSLNGSDSKIILSVLNLRGTAGLEEAEYDNTVKQGVDYVKKFFSGDYVYRLGRNPLKNEDFPEVYIGIIHLDEEVGKIREKANKVMAEFESANKLEVKPLYSIVSAKASVLQQKADNRLVLEGIGAFEDNYFRDENNSIIEFELN